MGDFIIDGIRSDGITVGDLRLIIADLPDNTQVWVFNQTDITFAQATAVTHDKRANGVNIWFDAP